MRIGIVVEGPTDVIAAEHFLRESLWKRGIMASFVNLQPPMDNTSPDGGWATVLRWLEDNQPRQRVASYFNGGLFEDRMSAKECDAIMIHLDTDVLSQPEFRESIRTRLGYDARDPDSPLERGAEMRVIIGLAAQFDALVEIDRRRHIAAPAVEATEAWCVGVFRRFKFNPEELRDLELTRCFMKVLHRSEGRVLQEFRSIDKSLDRRRKFCTTQASGFSRLEQQCHHYSRLVELLVDLHEEAR